MTPQQERDYAESVALGLPGVGMAFDPPKRVGVWPAAWFEDAYDPELGHRKVLKPEFGGKWEGPMGKKA